LHFVPKNSAISPNAHAYRLYLVKDPTKTNQNLIRFFLNSAAISEALDCSTDFEEPSNHSTNFFNHRTTLNHLPLAPLRSPPSAAKTATIASNFHRDQARRQKFFSPASSTCHAATHARLFIHSSCSTHRRNNTSVST
jgi:hypothetical protein